LTFSDGQQNTQALLYLKVIDNRLWAEFYTDTPLDRKKLRQWVYMLEDIKEICRREGFNEIYAGCSDTGRVKWVNKMFGFEKIEEISVEQSNWSVVRLCF
jgi:hypothetical protein